MKKIGSFHRGWVPGRSGSAPTVGRVQGVPGGECVRRAEGAGGRRSLWINPSMGQLGPFIEFRGVGFLKAEGFSPAIPLTETACGAVLVRLHISSPSRMAEFVALRLQLGAPGRSKVGEAEFGLIEFYVSRRLTPLIVEPSEVEEQTAADYDEQKEHGEGAGDPSQPTGRDIFIDLIDQSSLGVALGPDCSPAVSTSPKGLGISLGALGTVHSGLSSLRGAGSSGSILSG